MQILFALSFGLVLAASLFIGNALAGGYSPYAATGASVLYLFALFMPFLSEYNVLHRGISKIGDNFKTLMHTNQPKQGDVEIIVPGESHGPAEQYDFNQKTTSKLIMILIIILASGLLTYDAVNFYIMGDGLKPSDAGPISNF